MPLVFNGNAIIQLFLNAIGGALYPLALALLLPVYMYAVVNEKEEKLIQIMKMNGMQMWKYWVTNFLFDIIVYVIMVVIFFLFGIFIIDITYFYQTNWFL